MKMPKILETSTRSTIPGSGHGSAPKIMAYKHWSFTNGALWVVFAILPALLVGCGPKVLKAPFPYVPSSIQPGDLRGPYSGRILAAGTNKPVSGAVIYATWHYCKGVGFCSPAGFRQYLTQSNRNGYYRIPNIEDLKGPTSKDTKVNGVTVRRPGRTGSPPSNGVLAGFRLLVYKKGYVAYRSDRFFPDGERRLDFSQRDNVIRLEQWSSEFSHLEHVRFIGAVGRLRKNALWELHAAQAELEGRSVPKPRRVATKLLDASKLMDEDDIQEQLGSTELYEVGRLKSMPRTATSDSLHFKAAGKGEEHDLAFRVWKLAAPALRRHYLKLMRTYPSAKPVDQVGDRSFVARAEKILAHVFMDNRYSVVISVTCGIKLCPDAKRVLKIAMLLHGRLKQLIQKPDKGKEPEPPVRLDPFKGKQKQKFIPRLNP